MILEHAVLAAEMAVAEVAVPNYALRNLLALVECTPNLLWWHAATQRQANGQGCRGLQREGLEGC